MVPNNAITSAEDSLEWKRFLESVQRQQVQSFQRQVMNPDSSTEDSSDDITNQETHDEPPLIFDALHIEIYFASRYIIPVLEEILARDEHSIA